MSRWRNLCLSRNRLMVEGLLIPKALIAVVGGNAGSISISRLNSRSQILSSIPVPLGRPRLAVVAGVIGRASLLPHVAFAISIELN